MHAPANVAPLAEWQVFLRLRTRPNAPVTLPSKPSRKAKRALAQKDRQLVPVVMTILESAPSGKFQYEGAMRNGLRSGFCLDGSPWQRADARAMEIVSEALRRIGAVRPSWQEAQPDYADDRTERWHCKNCGKPTIVGENGRLRDYCSDDCLYAFHARMNGRYGHRQTRAEYLASRAARRLLPGDVQRDCDRCGTMFTPTWRFATYCPECRNVVKREKVLIHEDRPCIMCGTLFRPRKLESKYCSKSCETAGKRERPASTDCQTCGKTFVPDQVGRKFCCHACFAASKAIRKYEPRPCTVCGESFAPGQPNAIYCSLRCQARANRANKAAQLPPHRCENCGGEFRSARPEARFCGTSCSAIARNRAKREAANGFHCEAAE